MIYKLNNKKKKSKKIKKNAWRTIQPCATDGCGHKYSAHKRLHWNHANSNRNKVCIKNCSCLKYTRVQSQPSYFKLTKGELRFIRSELIKKKPFSYILKYLRLQELEKGSQMLKFKNKTAQDLKRKYLELCKFK